ncbi:ATP-binding protein [Candidatus Omnitrophota bacterium]
MAKRKIIKIDEAKCDGCGECIPNCPEGALKIIDGKARLISDLSCDGLGACIGYCPEGAITIEEREAEPYNERKVMETIVKQGKNTIEEHLEHLKGHGEHAYFKQAIDFLKEKNIEIPAQGAVHAHAHGQACPGSKIIDLRKKQKAPKEAFFAAKAESQLGQWPVQLRLVPAIAPFLNNADILVAADCVPFAYADFHQELLKGKILLVGCPKLDNIDLYREKFKQILENNDIKSITNVHMEVPCCSGLISVIKEAIADSGKQVPFQDITISIKGERL